VRLGVNLELNRAIEPAYFRHPRASRESRIGDAVVAYALERGRRRTIGFAVGPDGLMVRAPRWTPLFEIEAALQEKSRWILTKLHEARERQQRLASARIVWENGASIPYLGQPLELLLDPAHGFKGRGAALAARVQLHAPAQLAPSAQPGQPELFEQSDSNELTQQTQQLRVSLANGATEAQIRDAVQAWLMREAKQNFLERMAHFAPRLGVRWNTLRLSNAGTRWGSASADGTVRLNWRLIHFRQPVIDYVVAHELSHLREMNHSPRFWDTVAAVVPDYNELRRQLKEDAIPRW